MPKLCPKILLEGTRLTHKTDLAFLLNEHPRIVGPRRYRYHSPVISAEWCAFTNHPWGRGLINFLPEEEERAMEAYRTWAQLLEQLPYYSWIVDRFHLSTQAYQGKAHGRPLDFRWLEERLLRLGFRLVLCTRRPEDFPRAREQRLLVSGNPKQYDDLLPFLDEQETLRGLAARSILPWMELDVSDDDLDAAADRVADWLEATGGLHLPDGLLPPS